MRKKILLLPLDERPCNFKFPLLMPSADIRIIRPPRELLGNKKIPADCKEIARWVIDNVRDVYAVILSMDMLIYGGLVPSRLHFDDARTLDERAEIVREIKKINPDAKLYGFQTIMRCPFYSLSNEEPDYYAEYGAEIHLYGRYAHKQSLGLLAESEERDFARIKALLPDEVLRDFTERRKANLHTLLNTLRMVGEDLFDGFIVSQDDSAPYGFTAMDQSEVREYIKRNKLQLKAPIYPSADEAEMTLLARAVNELNRIVPKIYVYYASAFGATVTPAFEDRTIDATVKCQILSAGCQRVYEPSGCDIFLAVNIGAEMPYRPTKEQLYRPYDVERSLAEFVSMIKYELGRGKIVAVADVAYPSNADEELLRILHDEDLLLKIHAYAGWNTSSNTLGTVICEACLYNVGRDRLGNEHFLIHRYYDDVGYVNHARAWTDVHAALANGYSEECLDGERGMCTEMAKGELMRYMRENYPRIADRVEDIEVSSPWNRSFEMDFSIKYKD